MIYFLEGILRDKKNDFCAIEVGGVAFKVRSSSNVLKSLPKIGDSVKLYTHLHVREDALDLYGFLEFEELQLFESLISVSGIGPKSAMNILGIDKLDKLRAAINEGRVELLTKASGVGKKTAERVVLELRGKLAQSGSQKLVGLMESDQDILEVLVNLGYTRSQAKDALEKVPSQKLSIEERIKEALSLLKRS